MFGGMSGFYDTWVLSCNSSKVESRCHGRTGGSVVQYSSDRLHSRHTGLPLHPRLDFGPSPPAPFRAAALLPGSIAFPDVRRRIAGDECADSVRLNPNGDRNSLQGADRPRGAILRAADLADEWGIFPTSPPHKTNAVAFDYHFPLLSPVGVSDRHGRVRDS